MSDLKKIIKLLYNSNGCAGVARLGYYNISKKIFYIGAAEYLKTGKNQFPALDKIYHASWYERKKYGRSIHHPMIDQKEYKILEDFLNKKGFWVNKISRNEINFIAISQYLQDGIKK